MPARKTPRPLRSAFRSSIKGDMRNYESLKNRGATPSQHFDWDKALLLYAYGMRALGYTLSETQQKRIDDHDDTKD